MALARTFATNDAMVTVYVLKLSFLQPTSESTSPLLLTLCTVVQELSVHLSMKCPNSKLSPLKRSLTSRNTVTSVLEKLQQAGVLHGYTLAHVHIKLHMVEDVR